MTFDKAIKYGKEKRKPYYGAKAVAPQCRCNGGCERCSNGRQHKNTKRLQAAKEKEKEK